MTRSTRATALFVSIFAIFALTAASASANISLSGGATSIAVNPSFNNKISGKEVTSALVTPASGSTSLFSLPIRGGLIVQSTGAGTYRTSGGIAFAQKSKKINIANLRFTRGSGNYVSATVGGQQMVAFSASPGAVVRNGFNTDVRSVVLRFNGAAATRINSVLGLKKKKKAFAANQLFATVTISSIAAKIEVAAGGRFRIQLDSSPLNKLATVGVKLTPMKPAKTASAGKLIFPGAGGGYLKPTTYTGGVNFSGGLSFKRGSSSLKLRFPVANIAALSSVTLTRSNGKKIKFAHVDATPVVRTVDLRSRKITLSNLHLVLTLDGSHLLNNVFKTTRFSQNDPLGVATLEVKGK
jgi:hypothetical protein